MQHAPVVADALADPAIGGAPTSNRTSNLEPRTSNDLEPRISNL
jgi:hypothetical protein